MARKHIAKSLIFMNLSNKIKKILKKYYFLLDKPQKRCILYTKRFAIQTYKS